MPAYSFKERFVPFILNGTKNQTIRKKRKHQVKEGQTLYLFYGLRTNKCKKLKEVTCVSVFDLTINANGSVYRNGEKLKDSVKDLLAFEDGFRNPNNENQNDKKGCFEIMFRWWKQTHELPFIGDIIYW